MWDASWSRSSPVVVLSSATCCLRVCKSHPTRIMSSASICVTSWYSAGPRLPATSGCSHDISGRDAMHFILFVLIGLIAGALAGRVVSGHGYGVVGDLIVGGGGALLGGWLFAVAFGVVGGGFIVSLLTAFVGGGHSALGNSTGCAR